MKFYLNYGNEWKGGVYGHAPAAIHDEVEIVLPEGFKEVEVMDGSKAVEWPDGQITLATEIFTEHTGGTAVPYIVDCSGKTPKEVYLKVKK